MCGRFTLRTPLKDVLTLFDLSPSLLDDAAVLALSTARYNIAPTQNVAVVRLSASGERELAWLHWGLVPSWADDPAIGNQLINARSETVDTKPAFRQAFRRRRCLIPADGFYEWQKQGRSKQPYLIERDAGRPFAFAGLWDRWQRGELAIESCTILTTEANAALQSLHTRMPVILDRADYARWLDVEQDREALEPLLAPSAADVLTLRPVSSAVNSPRHDGPECLQSAPPRKQQGSLFD